MGRVVPSQVVAAIDQIFPFAAAPPAQGVTLYDGHASSIAAVVALTEEIPEELFALDLPDYVQLVLSLAVMRNAVDMWKRRVPGTTCAVPGNPVNPITLLRRVLVKCPDEAATPGTADLTFIADQDLRGNIRLDISEVNKHLTGGEWKGATVLAGSSVEALLLWALQQHEAKHPGTINGAQNALIAARVLSRQPDPNPERWDLHEYIEVAAHLALIEPNTAAQARQAKDFRNLIHPGRVQRTGQKCDRGTTLAAVAAVEFVVRDLTP